MFHVKHRYCLRSAFLFKITCQNSDIPRTPSTSCLGFVFFHENLWFYPQVFTLSTASWTDYQPLSQENLYKFYYSFLIFHIHEKLRCPAESSLPSLAYHKLFLSPLSGNEHKKRVEDTSENVFSTPFLCSLPDTGERECLWYARDEGELSAGHRSFSWMWNIKNK